MPSKTGLYRWALDRAIACHSYRPTTCWVLLLRLLFSALIPGSGIWLGIILQLSGSKSFRRIGNLLIHITSYICYAMSLEICFCLIYRYGPESSYFNKGRSRMQLERVEEPGKIRVTSWLRAHWLMRFGGYKLKLHIRSSPRVNLFGRFKYKHTWVLVPRDGEDIDRSEDLDKWW